jgi:hypothetical protein
MPLYSFRCDNCGAGQTINSSIRDYPDVPNARCMACKAGEMKRDYRADKPQPAAMWPEHYNPSTGTVVRSRRQLQDDLNRGAQEQFDRTGIPSSPVVVDRADMGAIAPPPTE